MPAVRPAVLAVLLLASVAAHARGDDVEISSQPVAKRGESPLIILRARKAAASVVVTLTRADGTVLRLDGGRMRAGDVKKLKVDQPEGKFHYEGELTVRWGDRSPDAVLPITLDAIVAPPLVLRVLPTDVHLDNNELVATMTSPADSIKFVVYGDSGALVDEGEAQFNGAAAGEKLVVSWRNSGHATVLRVDLVAHDVNGMFSPTLQLFPWSLEIPHEDVLFPTGESTIPTAELTKIRDAVENIQAAVKRYGMVVKITLFIEGHTDSVGNADYNLRLSEARALSIARAVRAQGVRVPIKYAGFGEERLKVRTLDDVDEPQNRRAVYTLAAELARPGRAWHTL